MNLKKVQEIIESYKKHFDAVHKAEIYKWRAVKRFQDYWDIDAINFPQMLENSLAFTYNLMDSGQHFPRRMILQYARFDTEVVKEIFAELYREDEVQTLEDKWFNFHTAMEDLHKRFVGSAVEKKSYQLHRAFMVYLTLRFPEKYFLYKFRMFQEFVDKVDFPYEPKTGRVENLIAYSKLCKMLRAEIIKDEELLQMHHKRLNAEQHYIDTSYNLLTQDVIYATVVHFDRFETTEDERSIFERLIKIDKLLIPKQIKPVQGLPGRTVDYFARQKANKQIGNYGEQLVFNYERTRLKQRNFKKEPVYVAATDDSQGFDILSYGENGQEIYIEVKTTTQSCETAFFITSNELRKSIEASERYYLYRVYDYNAESDTGKFSEFRGSLESLCVFPTVYKASVMEQHNTELSASSAQIRG
jgi:Domain of unknown function (DUF3883)